MTPTLTLSGAPDAVLPPGVLDEEDPHPAANSNAVAVRNAAKARRIGETLRCSRGMCRLGAGMARTLEPAQPRELVVDRLRGRGRPEVGRVVAAAVADVAGHQRVGEDRSG